MDDDDDDDDESGFIRFHMKTLTVDVYINQGIWLHICPSAWEFVSSEFE